MRASPPQSLRSIQQALCTCRPARFAFRRQVLFLRGPVSPSVASCKVYSELTTKRSEL